MPLSAAARDVLSIFDRFTSPRKRKLQMCVSLADDRLFLRINSGALFEPAHRLLKAENEFLHVRQSSLRPRAKIHCGFFRHLVDQ
jgi:hypothetical protein